MGLLNFARGPALRWALVIMVAGSIWRFIHFAFRRSDQDVYWARKSLHVPNQRWQLDSYAMHAGLLIVLFGFTPHILLIGALTGITWPSLPTIVILAAAVVSIGSMLAVLAHRMTASEPSLFPIFDDYFTWTVVFVAMLTGLVCYPHIGGGPIIGPYAALLTAHLLAVELLMIWLPFGKLIHVAFMPMLQAGSLILRIIERLSAQLRTD
jgi:nitrate reductase gamma subunit